MLCPYTGGGFGCKGFDWSHTMLAAMAAKVTGRPVQLNLTRQQMFTSVGHRPPTLQTIALAAQKDGKLTAIRHETLQPTSTTTEFVEPCGMTTSKMIYSCENVAIPHRLVKVNVGPPTPMRAPGDCPGSFAIESAMDELAYALGMDPSSCGCATTRRWTRGRRSPGRASISRSATSAAPRCSAGRSAIPSRAR